MPRRIGLLIGEEDSFVLAMRDRLAGEAGIEVELTRVGGTPERFVSRYDAMLDRASHLVCHYRHYVLAAALAGTVVLNDPRRAFASDRFVALSMAARLGLRAPRAVLLPQKRYGRGVAPERMLHNLEYPLRWRAILDYVGVPALLRPAGRALGAPIIVHDEQELLRAYDATGEEVMMLQAQVEGRRVRCVPLDEEDALVLELDPDGRPILPHAGQEWLAPAVRSTLGRGAARLTRALGCALGAVDAVVRGGEAELLDAVEPMPDLRRELLGDHAFERVVEAVARRLMDAARSTPGAFWSG